MAKDAEQAKDDSVINWTAEEFLPVDHNAGWYIGLFVVGLLLGGVAVYLAQWSFLTLVVVCILALVIYTRRPPRELHYSLSNKGLSEGDKLYDFSQFKAFGVLQDGQKFSIMLVPKKRFSPQMTVYFPENMGEQIVDIFGGRLPMETVKLDLLDRLVRFMRI